MELERRSSQLKYPSADLGEHGQYEFSTGHFSVLQHFSPYALAHLF
ncbi:Uncharacterised protein [Vibrio cholerae]|nr:Uncharacterised protein [Vibrio cholerae]